MMKIKIIITSRHKLTNRKHIHNIIAQVYFFVFDF